MTVLTSPIITKPPLGWRELPQEQVAQLVNVPAGRGFTRQGILVLCSPEDREDGMRLHVSISHRERPPTFFEVRDVKETFLGDVWAYQVMPPSSTQEKLHPYMVHLLARADGKDPMRTHP